MKEILTYKTVDNKSPFDIWYKKLDRSVQVRIKKRLERVAEGNLGDFKVLDNEISELRCSFGAGYRIYFSEIEEIKKAKKYLKDLKSRSI